MGSEILFALFHYLEKYFCTFSLRGKKYMLFFGCCYICQFLKFAFCCEFLLHSKKHSLFTQFSVYNFTDFLQEVPPESYKLQDLENLYPAWLGFREIKIWVWPVSDQRTCRERGEIRQVHPRRTSWGTWQGLRRNIHQFLWEFGALWGHLHQDLSLQSALLLAFTMLFLKGRFLL